MHTGSSQNRKMENLEKLNIDSVALVGSIFLNRGDHARLSTVLSKHQDNWPRRRIDKLGFYEVDGVRHHIGLEIEMGRGANPDIARFTLEAHPFSKSERLRSTTRKSQEQKFDEIQAILSDLGELNLPSSVHSHITWMFPPDSMKSIIELPMMTVQNPSIPFTEISGIRLRKRASEGSTRVTIDLRDNRSLTVTLVFPLPDAKISDGMMDYTTHRGSQIIGDFVFGLEAPLEDREA